MLPQGLKNPKNRGVGIILTALLVAAAFILATPTADAQAATGTNPCPHWSIQGVYNDPNGDWDRDRVTNGTELNYGENPCVAVKATFCNEQPSLCTVRYVPASTACSYGTYWTNEAVNQTPNADWDGDGVTNKIEADAGANPCAHPCPRPTNVDLSLNPYGDWDLDRYSNSTEIYNGTNPCVRNTPITIVTPAPKPIPTVVYIYTQVSTPPPGYKCPVGFPYYYAHTGLCHAARLR